MIFPTVNKIPAFVLDKLDLLFRLLRERKSEFEIFAEKMTDKHLKRTVLTLAQETNQYAVELCSQLEVMGGMKDSMSIGCLQRMSMPAPVFVTREDDILKSCEVSEKKMISAYRSVLNEPYLHENLRKLIRCQLNGIMYAFMQLRLLNTSLYTSFHR